MFGAAKDGSSSPKPLGPESWFDAAEGISLFVQVMTLNGHTSGIKMIHLNDDFEQLVSLSLDRSPPTKRRLALHLHFELAASRQT